MRSKLIEASTCEKMKGRALQVGKMCKDPNARVGLEFK